MQTYATQIGLFGNKENKKSCVSKARSNGMEGLPTLELVTKKVGCDTSFGQDDRACDLNISLL